jgi:hypothetical protein
VINCQRIQTSHGHVETLVQVCRSWFSLQVRGRRVPIFVLSLTRQHLMATSCFNLHRQLPVSRRFCDNLQLVYIRTHGFIHLAFFPDIPYMAGGVERFWINQRLFLDCTTWLHVGRALLVNSNVSINHV